MDLFPEIANLDFTFSTKTTQSFSDNLLVIGEIHMYLIGSIPILKPVSELQIACCSDDTLTKNSSDFETLSFNPDIS